MFKLAFCACCCAHAQVGSHRIPEALGDTCATLTSDGVLRLWRAHVAGTHTREGDKIPQDAVLLLEARLFLPSASALLVDESGEHGDGALLHVSARVFAVFSL